MDRRLLQLTRVMSRIDWYRLAAALGLYVVPVFLFVQLADEVRDRETLGFDTAVLHTINGIESPPLDVLAVVLTQFGSFIGVLVLMIGAAALLFGRRRRREAVFLVVAVTGAALLNVFLKAIFERDRPQLWERLVVEVSYSFPSGHAMASCALALSVVVVAWNTRYRWWLAAIAGVYVIGIALTRLYLGVHYPTDIAAGWIVSAVWVAIAASITVRSPTRPAAHGGSDRS